MNVQLGQPLQVFGVAGGDPWTQFPKALLDEFAALVELRRTVDAVTDVHVDGKCRAIDRADQSQIGVGPVGYAPTHHLDGELRAPGLDLVDHVAAVFHRGIEEFLRKVLGMRPVPDLWIVGTGNVGTAARTHGLGQRQALGYVMQVLGALIGVGVEHVDPCPNLGDHDVFGGERLLDFTDAGRVIHLGLGTIGRTVAQSAVLAREFRRIVAFEKDGTTEANRSAGRGCERSRQRGCKLPAREWNHVEILSVGMDRCPDTAGEQGCRWVEFVGGTTVSADTYGGQSDLAAERQALEVQAQLIAQHIGGVGQHGCSFRRAHA